MSLSAVFKYMANLAVDCSNMVVTVKGCVRPMYVYSQRILTKCTRILLLDLT